LASAFSEYGIAPLLAVAPVALAAGVPRRRAGQAGLLALLCALAGYCVLYLLADYSRRADAMPGEQLQFTGVQDVVAYLSNSITVLWRMVIGLPAASFAAVRANWGEKSTIASMVLGAILALLAARAGPFTRWEFTLGRSKLFLLLGACWLALLPELVRQGFWVVEQWSIPEPLSSRFQVSAIPVASVLVTALLLSLVRPSNQIWVAAALGFVSGYALGVHPAALLRTQRLMAGVGQVVRPFVEKSSGVTLVLLDHYYGREYELVYHAARGWPPDLRKRLLISNDQRLSVVLDRHIARSTACRDLREVNFVRSGFIRAGPVSRVLFVRPNLRDNTLVEAYCVPPLAAESP
jgi:hypothetical protein